MQIYGPPQNKLAALKDSNPRYWAILLSRSQYSEAEINQALADIEAVNNRLRAFKESAYDLLQDENGSMDYFKGFASDAHRQLSVMLSEADYLSVGFSDNSHLNCFPVRKWQASVAKLDKEINKIKAFIAKNF
jgi:hypothetical protein